MQSYLEAQLGDSEKASAIYEGKVKHKAVNLGKTPSTAATKETKPDLGRRLHASAADIKKRNLFRLPKGLKYEDFVALNLLWTQYMDDIMKGAEKNEDAMAGKLLKADMHGGIAFVVRSKCPSIVGIGGIILQEHTNSLIVITKNNAVKTIPKAGNVFRLEWKRRAFTVYGNQFGVKTHERSTRKWKNRATVDL